MTKIITRYFDSVAKAKEVKHELIQRRRFSPRILDFHDRVDGLVKKLTAQHVQADTARAYAEKMASGGAVILVRATYKPLGVAKIAQVVMDDMGAADLGRLAQEVYIQDKPRPNLSVMLDHPRFLTPGRDPDSTTFHMADWPIALISRRQPFTGSVVSPNAHMLSWPIPLISRRKPYTGSMFPRHARMANFPIGLISQRKPYTGSIFARHARMASFPIPLISRRRPYTGTLIGRHTRMANWLFPHLINGKTGTNALVPGGARMANFPISLLSNRKPFTGSIFSRHARMANFPIGLISQRKPYTGSVIPRHGRMADAILPLVLPSSGKRGRFSMSGFLGIPTVIRRR